MTENTAKFDDISWQKIQATTGLVFGLFVAVHLANTLLAIGGSDLYNAFQSTARAVYQHPVAEIALLFFILPLHIVAGIKRARWRRHRPQRGGSKLLAWHRAAGWTLVAVVYWHAGAVRLPAIIYGAWPEFAGVSFSLAWVPWWFYPYYFLLALAGMAHLLIGGSFALQRLRVSRRFPRPQRLALTISAGAIAIVVSLAAFGGFWFDVGDPFVSDYAKVYLSFVAQVFE